MTLPKSEGFALTAVHPIGRFTIWSDGVSGGEDYNRVAICRGVQLVGGQKTFQAPAQDLLSVF